MNKSRLQGIKNFANTDKNDTNTDKNDTNTDMNDKNTDKNETKSKNVKKKLTVLLAVSPLFA